MTTTVKSVLTCEFLVANVGFARLVVLVSYIQGLNCLTVASVRVTSDLCPLLFRLFVTTKVGFS